MMIVWISLFGTASAQDDAFFKAESRRLGLVYVGDHCSGTQLNQYWVLTSHDCVGSTAQRPLVTDGWSPDGVHATARVDYAYMGLDVVLLYLGGRNLGPVPVQPLFDGEVYASLTVRSYGQGRNMMGPGFGNRLYEVNLVDALWYEYAPDEPVYFVVGGDLGGPDVVEYGGIPLGISGVHSNCTLITYPPGTPEVRRCQSALIAPVRADILQRIQQVPPSRVKVGVSDHTTIGELSYNGLYVEHPESVSMRDTNGDGVDDIVAAVGEGLSARDVWVSVADAFGFAEAERWQGGSCPEGQTCLFDDVNGDRMADLVALGGGEAGEVQVSLSTGTGFDEPRPWLDRFCTGVDTCTLADVNGDGLSDVVSFTNTDGGPGDGDVWVALSTGDGFAWPEPWSTDFCLGRETCTTADVDGDGRADLVSLGDDGGGEIRVAPSTGDRFEDARAWGSAVHPDERTFFADTNADGLTDLVSFVPDGEVHVRLSSGDRFADPERWLSDFCTTEDVCTVGDVNGDGAADVIAVSTDG